MVIAQVSSAQTNKAVQYVKICSLYGAGFYYMPGTDTCIKIGGFVRAEVNFNAGGS
ncbi:MAG: porin, partial [Proteobacteria bacterium]|nr:porin [Pseudomonadota bacterium]